MPLQTGCFISKVNPRRVKHHMSGSGTLITRKRGTRLCCLSGNVIKQQIISLLPTSLPDRYAIKSMRDQNPSHLSGNLHIPCRQKRLPGPGGWGSLINVGKTVNFYEVIPISERKGLCKVICYCSTIIL